MQLTWGKSIGTEKHIIKSNAKAIKMPVRRLQVALLLEWEMEAKKGFDMATCGSHKRQQTRHQFSPKRFFQRCRNCYVNEFYNFCLTKKVKTRDTQTGHQDTPHTQQDSQQDTHQGHTHSILIYNTQNSSPNI